MATKKCPTGSKVLAYATALLCSFLALGVAQAAPLTMDWTGTILQVFDDQGSTTFTGTQAGDAFSGSFGYDSTPGTLLPGRDSSLRLRYPRPYGCFARHSACWAGHRVARG